MDTEFQFNKMKRVLWADGGDGGPTASMCSELLHSTFQNG